MRSIFFNYALLRKVKYSIRNGYSYIFLFLIFFLGSCTKPSIYVSSDGNDQNNGSPSQPVATLNRALELSRSTSNKLIVIRGGRYYNVSASLSAVDSGLHISGEPGKTVTLYGGKPLKNWKKEGNWFVTEVPGTRDRSWDFRILIVNDSLRQRARLPESDAFFHLNKWPHQWMSSQGGWSKKPTAEELTTLYYKSEDLDNKLDIRNAELTIFHAWDDSYVGLQSIDTIKHSVTFSTQSTHPAGAFGDGWAGVKPHQYIVWNVREGMKHPGQWYLDRTAEKLYYWPYPYENISDFEALAPTKDFLLQFVEGAKNIQVENVNISCVGAPMSNTGYGTSRIQGAVQGTGIDHISLKNISVKNVAGWADKVNGSDINISDGEFSFTGAGGISYNGNSIQIRRSGIHDVGKLYFGAVGIMGNGKRNLISHCELFNLPYVGINGLGARSVAEYNLIYNFKLMMKDGGAIYCYGGDSTIYKQNAVLFDKNNKIEGWSYYFDELSKNCIMEENLAVTTLVPIHHHMADSIIIRNNLFIDQESQGIDYQLSSDLSFTGNTFVADRIVFNGSIGETPTVKKETFNPVFQKYYLSNGITEFRDNKLYCKSVMQDVLHMYARNRTEPFNLRESRQITDENEIQSMRTTLPESFSQTGYRGNFSELFKEMISE